MIKFFNIILIFFSIAGGITTHGQQAVSFTTEAPIYVIGDIHGAYYEIQATLSTLGLIDVENNWSGGKAHFVSLGDLTDRGPATRKVMDLFMKLQIQAADSGGKFHIVLGNHEMMNLQGDWRYLSADEMNEFAADETVSQRTEAYQAYISWYKFTDNEETLTIFNDKYPAGFFAHHSAFSLTGKYGRWLVELPFIIKINDQLFTHGGLSKQLNNTDIESLNKDLKSALITYIKSWDYFVKRNQLAFDTAFGDRVNYVKKFHKSPEKTDFLDSYESLTFSKMGPAWYRGSALCHPYFEQDILLQKLKIWGATRLWVGHTATPKKKVQSRFSDRLVMMDTGMLSSHYNGRPWAAKIDSTGNTTYINGLTAEIDTPLIAANREYSNPYNMSDAEVEDFLKTAIITNKKTTKEGRTKPFRVTLEKDGKIMQGIFKYKDSHHRANELRWKKSKEDSDRFQYEVAAYKLDRLLDIGLVPVTVERTIDEKPGAIQIWIEGLISDLQINKEKIAYRGFCDPGDQVNMMDTFDYLIANRDRNQSNIVFSDDDWQIWFIDHSRAFGTSTLRPKILKRSKIKVSSAFHEALQKLQPEQLNALSPWLHEKQIQAIWMRRDKLIKGKF